MMKKHKGNRHFEFVSPSFAIRRQLYSLLYRPEYERASEFIAEFEELVEKYNNLPNTDRMSENEKRNIMYNAVVKNVPSMRFIKIASQSFGEDLTYNEIKLYIMQAEDSKIQLSAIDIRRKLYNLLYVPKIQRASKFIDEFEELVSDYNNLPNIDRMSETEKRDILHHAVVKKLPVIECAKIMFSDKELTYNELKSCIIQAEADEKGFLYQLYNRATSVGFSTVCSTYCPFRNTGIEWCVTCNKVVESCTSCPTEISPMKRNQQMNTSCYPQTGRSYRY